MKRYNWEYNGETMGLIERDNGICVLHSDVVELNETIESLRAEVERINKDYTEACQDATHESQLNRDLTAQNKVLRAALIKIRNFHDDSSTKTYQGMEDIAMEALREVE